MDEPNVIEAARMDKTKTTKFPNFLVIGAAKSGTYTLYEHFASHPEVFMSPRWAYSETPDPDQWPTISAKKVRFDEIGEHLPATTRRVTPEERRKEIEIRQRHVQKRFRVF